MKRVATVPSFDLRTHDGVYAIEIRMEKKFLSERVEMMWPKFCSLFVWKRF